MFCPNTKGLTNRRRLTALAYVVVLVIASLVRTGFISKRGMTFSCQHGHKKDGATIIFKTCFVLTQLVICHVLESCAEPF